jgi:hypothetical protein
MKLKLTRQVPTALAITALILSLAGMARAADEKNATNSPTALATTMTADPYTSLPHLPQAAPGLDPGWKQWIDPDWKDPGQVLPDLDFDMPLRDVGPKLREKFKDAFDVILPSSCDWQDPDVPATPDPGEVGINLRLKNVTATEVFNAMNLDFEAKNAPFRWILRMDGNRPLALLRVVPALLPQPLRATGVQLQDKRMVFFVGDLVGDEKLGGMTMEQLFKTVCQVYDMAYGGTGMPGELKFHQEAQLLIVNATVDKIDFVQNTLAALRQKERMPERTAVDSATKPEALKKSDAASEPNK